MKMIRNILLSVCLASAMAHCVYASERKSLFNDNWQFHLTDGLTKAQSVDAIGDSCRQDVRLPHDWSILHPFDRNAAPGNDGGYMPAGLAWYRKDLDIKKVPSDRTVKLYFEGAYERPEVYVNGEHAGGHPYGYTSFFVDITPYLRKGNNSIAVCWT